jgi:hypothetical protein
MAFTLVNSFLLTTDGQLFSWGALTVCLGRDPISKNEHGNE